jgi:hypothetical protein
MSLEIVLLHTILRLSRRRSAKSSDRALSMDDLVDRVRFITDDRAAVLRALRALARQGLVQRSPLGPRLTLAGLAVAVATKAQPRAKRLPGIAMPLVRRRSAA